jgi:hypothetical protein
MNRKIGIALLLGANFLLLARSTEVFRCGNEFSDLPCNQGAPTKQVDDARSRAQQQQSQAANQRSQAAAQSLQAQRLSEEAQARDAQRLASVAPPPPKPQAKPAPAWTPRKRHGQPSPHFTARGPDAAKPEAAKKK